MLMYVVLESDTPTAGLQRDIEESGTPRFLPLM
jgi:hypothetical protein